MKPRSKLFFINKKPMRKILYKYYYILTYNVNTNWLSTILTNWIHTHTQTLFTESKNLYIYKLILKMSVVELVNINNVYL